MHQSARTQAALQAVTWAASSRARALRLLSSGRHLRHGARHAADAAATATYQVHGYATPQLTACSTGFLFRFAKEICLFLSSIIIET